MKKTRSRILSFLLVLMMILSLGAEPAFALGREIGGHDDWDIGARDWDGEEKEWTNPDPEVTEENPGEDIILVDPEEPIAASMPAQSFSGSIEGMKVEVNAPEGAFLEGTVMSVTAQDLEQIQAIVSAAEGFEDQEVQVAADISFTAPDGSEAQPQVPVQVSITSELAANVPDARVLHISDDGVVTAMDEIIDLDATASLTNYTVSDGAPTRTIKFMTDSFSSYAIIGEAILDKDEDSLTFETDAYYVTVSYTEEAQIPAGTKLTVSEIPFLSEEYAELRDRAQDKLNENAVFGGGETDPDTRRGIGSAIFLDVSLEYNGEPFEPAVPLTVDITLKQGALFCAAGEDTLVVHFGEKGTELIEDVAASASRRAVPEGMPEGVMLNNFRYEQDGFSVVGLLTTDRFIDFAAAEKVDPYVPIRPMAEGDPTEPGISAGKTVTDQDEDGIYELALTVTGSSEQHESTNVTKSNVILVIDVSGSMDKNVWSEYTYSAETYSSSATYYTESNYGDRYRVAYDADAEEWYYVDYPSYSYTGTVYLYETRLSATKRAACNMVDVLTENNTGTHTDAMEISVIKFAELEKNDDQNYNGTEVIVSKETTAATIKTAINNLTAGGGTNWSAALKKAKEEADSQYKPEAGQTTSIIFLTDGLPTRYLNNNGTEQRGNGGEGDNNVNNSFNNAKPYARAIIRQNNQDTGYTLYSIFAYGTTNGSRALNNITRYAYTGGNNINWNSTNQSTDSHFYNASSTKALEDALKSIVDKINNNKGYAGVTVNDGVSLGATNTSVAVGGTVDTSSMRYSVYANSALYDVKIADGKATFTIYGDGDPVILEDSTPETVATTINGTTIRSTVYSVTVGEGTNAKTYKMSPATFDSNGMVKWDLAGLGILENGVTYQLSFDVWPNQRAYDIAADLNNGLYATVDEALTAYNITGDEAARIKNALRKNDNGTYEVHTNYVQSVDYYEAQSATDEQGNTTWTYGDKKTKELTPPDAIELKGSKLPLTKLWEASLSQSELDELLWNKDGTSTKYGVTLHVWKADTEAELNNKISQPVSDTNKPYKSYPLGWDEETQKYVWNKDMAVAPGMMLSKDKAAELGFNVNDTSKLVTYTHEVEGEEVTETYYVVESGHYYYVTEDGSDLHFELTTKVYHPMIVDGKLVDLTFNGTTVERMEPMASVVATNTLKGGIDIYKKVYKEDHETLVEDCDDQFTFVIKLSNADGAVYTTPDQFDKDGKAISGSIGFRVFVDGQEKADRGSIVNGDYTFEHSHVTITGAEEGSNETVITLTMRARDYSYIVNVPANTNYTVEEVNSDTDPYQLFKTTYRQEEDETKDVELDTAVATGVVHGNTAEFITFHNWAANFYVYHSSNNKIEKISFADPRVTGTYDAEKSEYVYTFNIANETIGDSLYGGYYSDYSGKGTFELTGENALTFTKATSAIATVYDGNHKDGYWSEAIADGAPYTGDVAGIWKAADQLTVNGMEMHPVSDGIYYLKEVPASKYLLPYLHYTYHKDTGAISTAWLMSDIDDANYQQTGVVIVEANKEAKVCETLTVNTTVGGNSVKLTAKRVFKSANVVNAYLTYREVMSGAVLKDGLSEDAIVLQYWVTPDGLIVTGTTSRVYEGLDNKNDVGTSSQETVASTVAKFQA